MHPTALIRPRQVGEEAADANSEQKATSEARPRRACEEVHHPNNRGDQDQALAAPHRRAACLRASRQGCVPALSRAKHLSKGPAIRFGAT